MSYGTYSYFTIVYLRVKALTNPIFPSGTSHTNRPTIKYEDLICGTPSCLVIVYRWVKTVTISKGPYSTITQIGRKRTVGIYIIRYSRID